MDYFVRLFNKRDYAEQFLSGQLRLLPAGYYIGIDGCGRGDALEGAVSKNESLNLTFPILCLLICTVQQSNGTNILRLNTDVLRDFCKCGGYGVAIEKSLFLNAIEPLIQASSTEQQPSYHGKVEYDLNKSDLDERWDWITGKKDNLLHKRKEYSYQNEYRFIFSNPSHYTFCLNDGFNQPWRVNIRDLHEISYAFRISPTCEMTGSFLEVPLRESLRASFGTWLCKEQIRQESD